MTQEEIATIRAVVGSLQVRRNRFGKLENVPSAARTQLQQHAIRLGIGRGGLDVTDQATMVLQALIGDLPTSILDVRS